MAGLLEKQTVKMQTVERNGHGKLKVFSFTSKLCTYINNVYSSPSFTYFTCVSFPSYLRSVVKIA